MSRGRKDDTALGPADDGMIVAEEELALTADERLPWLESDDDYEQPGVDTGRIVMFAAVSLFLLAAIVGGLWWLTSDRSPGERVADGSVIEAPDEPYRTRPENPGGREVEGTGDTSFVVAEGEQVESRIAPLPAPPPPEAEGTPKAEAPAAAPGVGVQVAAYSSREAARAGWATLIARMEPLQGRSHRIVEGTVDGARVYRLQAVAGSNAEADVLCREIKAAGGDCQVKR